MPYDAVQYKVLTEFDIRMPSKLTDMFSSISIGKEISTSSLFLENKLSLTKLYGDDPAKQSAIKQLISKTIKQAYEANIIQKIDNGKSIPSWFEKMDTVSYWQAQLRGSKQKRIKGNDRNTTKRQYLYQLWVFNRWLSKKTFSINSLQINKDNSFRQKKEDKKFKNVEELLGILEGPFADQKNVSRIIKQYLLDELHVHKKASYLTIIKNAIVSYFEKNEHHLQIIFNAKNIQKNTDTFEQSMSLSELMDFLTTGKPSITEKAVFLCKFHRGLDASTLADRFNFEAWGQLVKYFGSKDHNSWDLDKCPVPITLERIKTDYVHIGFLERDAIIGLQKYLDFRKKITKIDIEFNEPIFLNKFKKPISSRWITQSFSRIAKRSGIQECFESDNSNIKQYKMDSHELRDLLKSTLIDSGCRIDVADHVIGHKPKDSYEKQSKLYPETLRKEYAKASKRLNIFTKFTSVVNGIDDSDELKIQLREKLSELDIIKESRLSDEARQLRNDQVALEQARQMRLLQDTVNELKKEIKSVKQTEKKPIEFCCISCSTVHDSQVCPACGSKMKRIYEENI